MKKFILTLSFLLFATSLSAFEPSLKFNKRGEFKIVQITDTHYIVGNANSVAATQLLQEVIDEEKPDLIIFTGDMVWKNRDTKMALDSLFEPVVRAGVPWAYIFGNHDDEAELTRTQIMGYVVQKPHCLATHGNELLSGVGNYVLEIWDREAKGVDFTLFCLDSHAYSKVKSIGGYAWFEEDQIEWFRESSEAYRALNGGVVVPALAFFHIPLPEYAEMSTTVANLVGTKMEKECSGRLNPGMFATMSQMGNVFGLFVGHDHDNDYIGSWYDIALAYGRFSGGDTVYNNLGLNGCRVIKLKEGVREFKSYIRLLGGEIIDKVDFPSSFKTTVEESE